MPRFVCPVITEKTNTGRTGEKFYLYFYDGYSGDSVYTYSDNALTIPNSNPVESDEYGVFPDIFLAARDNGYRVEMKDANGKLFWNKSEVYGAAQAPSNIGAKRGVVWMFYGTQSDLNIMLADGWAIADGTNGPNGDATPNLCDSFLRLVTSVFDITDVSAGASTITLTGTVDGHALTVDEMPAHDHIVGDSNTVYQLDEVVYSTLPAPNQDRYPINSGNTTDERYGEHADAGGGSTHTHSLTFNAYSSEPAFITLIPIIYGY